MKHGLIAVVSTTCKEPASPYIPCELHMQALRRSHNKIHEVFGELQPRLNNPKGDLFQLNIVNGLWLEKSFRFDRTFRHWTDRPEPLYAEL